MSAAKISTMRPPSTSEEAGSGPPQAELRRPRHPVLSRSLSTSSKVPSVPYLLNISGGSSALHDEDKRALTPPASSTKMQFLSPGWPGSSSAEASPIEARSRRRQSSMDSLMRAAATVESDSELNQLYQDKLSFIIELKNRISDEIRDWPVVQEPEKPSTPNRETGAKILLDRISAEQLSSLGNVVCRLKETVEELAELKSQTPHIKENMASKLQRDLTLGTPQRMVTLPPMESLTMNLPQQEQSAFHSYRFPSGTTNPPTLAQQQQQQHQRQQQQQRHHQSAHQHQVITSWPLAAHSHTSPTESSHRFTLSDPAAYTGPTAMPVIFKSPAAQSSLGSDKFHSKKKSKNFKFQKKRKKSLPELSLGPPQYRRSLTQGLIIAENVRQTEQATTSCVHCKEGITPEWRRGPYGNRTLCNACGLFYRKLIKKFSTRDANILMRYKRQINPEDRRVPSDMDVPETFIAQLEGDPNLDSDFNTIGGLASNYKLG
ncbi:uncharacterized protein ZBAI_06445 [Zygosaccharomyces bailii ISA1307]|nr:uncharacterized protein ZBAI_06445 [Zygosaccharomyces bailii ISA1307]